MKISIFLIVLGLVGMQATAWLGAYLSMRWYGACAVQFIIFLIVTFLGAYRSTFEDDQKK